MAQVRKRSGLILFMVSLTGNLRAAQPSNSILVRSYEFDRGNVIVHDVGTGYADTEPVVLNGGPQPNTMEYDLEFPVTAQYALWAKYAATDSRPVDIFLDDALITRGFAAVTGSWQASSGRWEKQGDLEVTAGKHCLKFVCPGPCIPHIIAFRLDSSQPFPPGWKRKPRPLDPMAHVVWSGKPEPGRYEFAAYVRPDGFVDAPADYDPIVPFERLPPPVPRAERVLEYLLMGEGKYRVEARIEPEEDGDEWVAYLSAQVNEGRTVTDILPLHPERIRKMLEHTQFLIRNFRRLAEMRDEGRGTRDEGQKAGIWTHDPRPTTHDPDTQTLSAEDEVAERMKQELEEWVASPKDDQAQWERVYDLYVRAYRLKNRVALSNPRLGFDRLLFAQRFTYDTSHIYTTYFDGSHRFGGNLCLLSPARPDGLAEPLVKGLSENGIYRDPDLSWDASRVLFSYKPDPPTPYRLYEIDLAEGDGRGRKGTEGERGEQGSRGTEEQGSDPKSEIRNPKSEIAERPGVRSLRQLTDSEYDDIDPCYLPDGRIMFVSTRCRRVVLCHNAFTVSVLYTMNADGSDVRCISANTVNDFTPSVLADGRVAYTRWEYVDKHLGNNQSLWIVSPDGSSPVHVAGEHWGPITLWEPRLVPGSPLLVCTLAPHMPIAVGPIALVDPADACTSPAVYHNLTPELPAPHHFGWARTDVGYYCNPFPLSEDYFLVSYAYGPDDREPAGYGIYLLDRWNNRDLIYRDPDISCFEAFPVQPRPRPPVVPPAAPSQEEFGTFCVLDVYQGLEGVERGTIKYLRVIEEIPKPVSAECSGYGLQYPVLSNYGHLALKKLWGEVPVEADGSVYFRAPADKPIYFAALDEDFMEIQRMRAFTQVRPGEKVSCVGCHEHRTTAPPNRAPLALRRSPADIAPPPDGAHAPDFFYDVQPVLNRHCVRCHTGARPAGDLDLSPDWTNLFNVAYENLTGRGYVSYVDARRSDTLPLRAPRHYGSHASRLIQVLRTTHQDRVQLPLEDFRRLVTWIDCNAPYYGTYLYNRPGTVGGRELLTPGISASLQAVYDKRCASCHGQDAGRIRRINFGQVEQSPALRAPLARAAGGTEACGQPVFPDRADPDAQALLEALHRLQQEIQTNPREDMLTARPPLLDENCRYVYR